MIKRLLGVTGHQNLPMKAVEFTKERLTDWYPTADNVTVVCSLAAGADMLVAEALMARGASLHVVVPSNNYASAFDDTDRLKYEDLLHRANCVEELDHPTPTETAYMAAGEMVVNLSDSLLAIWDGMPARGRGGTADVVGYAWKVGKPVLVVWPSGVSRSKAN